MLTFPKDNKQFSWTRHIKNKMVFYHLSGAQILRIFRKPKRQEEGIAPNTIAAMIPRKPASLSSRNASSLSSRGLALSPSKGMRRGVSSSCKPPTEELWIMYKINKGLKTKNKSRIILISAWRYPGVTKAGERPIIPDDVLAELNRL